MTTWSSPSRAVPARTPRAYALLATFVAAAAQAALLVIFGYQQPAVRADLDPLARDEIPVAITPVTDLPLLKYGAERPGSAATASPPRRNATPPPRPPSRPQPNEAPTPSPQASAEPSPSPTSEPSSDPSPDPSAGASASATEAAPMASGSPLGSDAGTETDPLKGRAAATYRAQLDGWFSARFHIRGKLPFEQLARLSASVVVTVADRRVVGFTLTAPSGDPVFDGQLRADLGAIQASSALLPAPPPAHPELLGGTVSLRFACASRAYCE